MGKLASVLRHELCVRQQQAAVGLQAAEARLAQTESDTVFAVGRCYMTVIYAQTQLKLADDALSSDPTELSSLRPGCNPGKGPRGE